MLTAFVGSVGDDHRNAQPAVGSCSGEIIATNMWDSFPGAMMNRVAIPILELAAMMLCSGHPAAIPPQRPPRVDERIHMCFSATASFSASAVIAVIGVATLRLVREPRTLLFAAMPLLFAFHQLTEGFVWLGLDGRIGRLALDHVAFMFTMYAQGLLPALMPLAVALMEPRGWRRGAILGLTAIGAVAAGWDAIGLISLPLHTFIDGNSVAYRNHMTGNLPISLLYISATCGALLLSTHRVVRWYGALNIVVLAITQIVKSYAFASVWCFYAAIMSTMIYWQFHRGNIDIATPNGRSAMLRPFLLPWLRWPRRSGWTGHPGELHPPAAPGNR